MKKKVFSLMMTLLLAFIGVAKADVVTIGEGTGTYYYYPVNMFYHYSLTQQIYTAEEIGTAGTINSISFYYDYSSSFTMNNVTLYMKNVTRDAFASNTDMEPLAVSDIVWTGTFTAAGSGWLTITLDTPFEYDGVSNLLVAGFDGTNGYPGSAYKFRCTGCTGYKGIAWYTDSSSLVPDPYNTGDGFSGAKTYTQYRNNIQLDITPGGGGGAIGDQLFALQNGEVVETVALGVRPNGCWMEPFTFQMRNDGPATTVSLIDFTPDGYFTLMAPELPVHMAANEVIDVQLATGTTSANAWQMVALYGTGRTARVWDITAEPYDPATPDVWEMACEEATSFPFVEIPANAHHTVLHNDYTLPFPEIPEGVDAVYKLVFDQDQILNASVTAGEDGKVALYRDGFEGQGGPMANNNYTGVVGGGGAVGAPFEAQIGEGTSTSTYFPFHTLWNYSIGENLFLASELTEAGVTPAPMTSLSWYVSSLTTTTPQNNISIWMANVDDIELTTTSHTTAGMTLVYTGNNVLPVAGQWNEFVFNEGNFSWDGHSNILILCTRNNGSYQGSISWQTHNPGFTAMSYHYSDTNGGYDVSTTPSTMYTSSTNRANIIMKGGNRINRDNIVLEEGFEGGSMPAGWTSVGDDAWTVGTGDYSTSTGANTGTYNAKITHSVRDNETYLITPAMNLSGATQGTLSFSMVNRSWAGDIDELGVYYRVNGGAWNQLYYTTEAHASWTAISNIALSGFAANYQLGFKMVDNYGYGIGLDDIVVTSNGGGGGDTPTPDPTPDPVSNMAYGPVIEDAAVEAGTYYLVASSTTPNFEVTINAEPMPCPAVEGFAFNPTPADNEDGVEPGSVTLRWNIPDYATGWRLVFGSTYHPEPGHVQTIIYPEEGWCTAMTNSYTVRNLWNNTNYFWHVEFNNNGSCPEGVSSPIWGFTTHLNIPQNLTADDYTVFNDEQITLHWNAVVDRTYRQYFIYRDGVKVGETQMNAIDNTSFVDGPLPYNMAGYTYYVTAIYDEGESAPSDPVTVKVSGYGDVNGHVYEQDGTTGIANATVTMVGLDEFGESHTYNFTTDGQGYYTGHIYAGSYNGSAACNGYQSVDAPIQGNPIDITYNNTTTPIDYIMDENFYSPCTVIAQYYPDSLDPQSPYVKVYWGCGLPGSEIIEDFETGDFSMFDWQVDSNYPWTVTTTNPYEGTYCMKSGGAGVANVVSNMTVEVEIPADGLMSFFGKISCESNWDYGYFFIDGIEKGSYTGSSQWAERTFDITAGTHTFQWRYTKDGSVNSNDDCFYVDYINFYKQPEPAIPGMTYDFENSTMQGWTSVDADGDGHGWMVASELMSGVTGHNGSSDFVFSQSYDNSTGVLYPDNYLVSPQVQLGGVLHFYACAQDNLYAAEHFGVAVSTTNTNPSSFTMLQEWTMSAKSMGDGTGKPVRNSRSGREQGNWYEYTVDLSAYSGMGYVAIRHFNCSDMFYLNVDDITIGEPGKGLPTNDRAFAYYRIYRTDCYNDGPYTEENTELLASEVTDTVYIDTYWPDVAPGVYKWGVGCVYIGNRGEEIEGPITWSEPTNVMPDMTNRDEVYDFENGMIPAGWTNDATYPWTVVNNAYAGYNGTYCIKSGNGGVASSTSSISTSVNYSESGTVSFLAGCWGEGSSDTYDWDKCRFYIDGTMVMDYGAHQMWENVSFNVSAGSHTFTWTYKKDGSVNPTGDAFFVDDVTFAYAGGGGGSGSGNYGAGTDPIQEPRESVIVWSNCLDKDMWLNNVDVTVLLNSADNPEGVTVNLTNLNEAEQELYPVAPVTLDETGFYAWETVRRGEYAVKVEFDGYEPIADTVSILGETHLRYVMTEILYGVGDVYVSRTGWAMWDEANIPGGGGGGGQSGNGDTFSYDFDNGMPAGWTTVDADGDGLTWVSSMNPGVYHNSGVDLTGTGHNSSAAYVISGSYANQTGQVLYPDNYLVSPQVTLAAGSTFSFWACAQDANYAAEHFGVAISDNGTSNWVMVDEWTMTAKSGGMMSVGRDGNNRAQGNWYQKTVDLSAYAGQKYIAIRHFNCHDEFILNVDDVELTAGAKDGDRHFEYYKVLCTSIDGVPIYNHNTVHPFCQLTTDGPYVAPLVEGDHYLCKVACVYSTGVSEWSTPVEWVYEPCDHWGPVDEVTVNTSGQGNHIEWVFENGYNPYGGDTPGPGPGQGDSFSYDFDNGMPAGWTTVDADGDGLTWVSSMTPGVYHNSGVDLTGTGHNSSAAYVISGSYANQTGQVLYPDNYLVSPQVTIAAGSTFSFWACAQDANYAAEHFGVAISDNGTSNWVMVDEWTMTAKSGGMMSVGRDGNNRAQGNWYQKTVDLSAFAGQKYIAIRHFNCHDQFILNVDDVVLTSGAKSYDAMNSGMLSNGTYALNITDIDNFDERVYFLYNLTKDARFDVINGEAAGMFIVSTAAGYEDIDLESAINEFSYKNNVEFGRMDKVQAADVANAYKASMPFSFTNSLMMDIYAKSRENNLCALADPFCTDNGMYEFPAGVNAGSGESGPDYDCLYTTPNPAWYYMRIGNPGDIDIYMYSTPAVDIDFCCWGPFDDPTTPCPNGLTENKVVSCSYSAQPTEHCMIPATAQTGEYYILVITNYSNNACNINFSKVAGNGDTDCGILPPVDIIGFLITQDGEYLAFAGPTDREYTDIDEFGEHEYCVRPIYPGEMTLPDHNFGWSMGCPVCAVNNGQIYCEAGAPIHVEDLGETDQIRIWWGEEPAAPVEEWLYYDDGTYATSIGVGGGVIYWASMFPAASIAPYAGTNLTKVALYENSYNTDQVTVSIYLGGANAPGTMVSTMNYNPVGADAFHEVTLTTPVAIDGTQNLWIVFSENGTYPANACADTGDPNNRWVSLDGADWMDVASAGVAGYGWMIRGFVTNQAKGVVENIAIEPVKPAVVETSGMTLSHSEVVSKPADLSFMTRASIVKYNVYRSTDNATYTLIGEVMEEGQSLYEYFDSPEAVGTYYYQVRALYDNDCESEPAVSFDDPTVNYVTGHMTGMNEMGSEVALYPNPTNGNVTIEANGMSRITVVSVLGQVVFDAEVNADTYTMNMAQFNAGMYMVRVYTESGVTVKRVTVMQ